LIIDKWKYYNDGMPEVILIEVNHDVDHIHMLISISPKMRISDVVRRIKSTTGRLLIVN